ncbi:acetyl-CoA synthetase-like protein [Aspergillus campestris IBT 28561]|uniref:Acetyl-CoA synthetase-like protein n=1 Tax=Aspergillus campestris (strain IBT 28561) TaxID=1392248 RepID=A0A2I1D3U9_ASPC2|nr:acetyl-CoA synthetase-like protein [Aspergillus campestris IBT 28561]PKY04528.1 acetyl-CoA synthetase-like protein [Aspergillus campestris IBT 28561]
MTITPDSTPLPNDAIFRKLLRVAQEKPDPIIRNDLVLGRDLYGDQLLRDVRDMRTRLQPLLAEQVRGPGGNRDTDHYVGILAPTGYELVVAALAGLALGAAFVPIRPDAPLDTIRAVVQRSPIHVVCLSSRYAHRAAAIGQAGGGLDHPVRTLLIGSQSANDRDPAAVARVHLDATLAIPETRPAAVYFTSGSTGPPKGVVHSRRLFARDVGGRGPTGTFLSARPADGVGGSCVLLLAILHGVTCEILDWQAGPDVYWARLRQGGVTHLTNLTEVWDQMARYYREHLRGAPAADREAFLQGARGLHVAAAQGGLAGPELVRFWAEEIGTPLTVMYGSTEMGDASLIATPGVAQSLDRCIGLPVPPQHVKLSEGDHGEILVKGPWLFARYQADSKATAAAFDADGYYRTGDAAHLDGGRYVFDGRLATDLVHQGGQTFSVLAVEGEVQKLDYVSEAVAVPIQEHRQVGVLVRFTGPHRDAIGLARLRHDLQLRVESTRLPIALRVLRDHDNMPLTNVGKIDRVSIAGQFSGPDTSSAEWWECH